MASEQDPLSRFLSNTSVHRALGESGALDHAMILRAVEAGVPEDDTLDWKGGEYRDTPDQPAADEFAKDVAAFANARGGLIVIGVSEDRKTGRAQRVTPVLLTDALERKMRSWLHTRVTPTLPTIGFRALRAAEGDGSGFLVVAVPASPDMPHMLGSKSSCGWPYRDGAQTQWMREFDLERAYRDRFARRESDEAALDRLIANASDVLDFNRGRWLVGAARPVNPLPSTLQPSVDQIRAILQTVNSRHAFTRPNSDRSPRTFDPNDSHFLNPRVGLRRWIMTNTASPVDPAALADAVHIEIHHDGSVVLAVAADPWAEGKGDTKDWISDAAMSGFAVALTNLASAATEDDDLAGDSLCRIELLGGTHGTCGMVIPRREGPFTFAAEQPGWSRDIRRFHAVDALVPKGAGQEDRAEIARTIITDVAAQFGVRPQDLGWEDVE